ncbi:uncharacterized protein LOC132293615 isoform X2 [Cornus florida]|uniref:uncharacterized protein LOC132293615 isoform X2 n=1 Tax=Cornus florida TaxID=4283 RepID=UPI0028A1D0F4|nr:uncharacterized protein LOC132293615 isoform X2 [Cornus florida]
MQQESQMEEPLLSVKSEVGDKESDKWSSYQYVGRVGSVIPTTSLAETEVSVDEIRSAAAFSDRYPPSLHAALVDTTDFPPDSDQAIVYQGQGGGYGGSTDIVQRQILDEVEIRELLIDHVGHRCCWGSRPARTWKIHAVEDCNVYVGTLETFIEERETIKETEPYLGGQIDGKDKGAELGIWELDLRSEFPVLFTPHNESRAKIPHSEAIVKCSVCAGRGGIVCSTCNADQEPGFYKENQMTQCAGCYGRGLIAHKDGSDTICVKCDGKGKIPCATCGSHGLVKCGTCQGCGSLLTRNIAVVRCVGSGVEKLLNSRERIGCNGVGKDEGEANTGTETGLGKMEKTNKVENGEMMVELDLRFAGIRNRW